MKIPHKAVTKDTSLGLSTGCVLRFPLLMYEYSGKSVMICLNLNGWIRPKKLLGFPFVGGINFILSLNHATISIIFCWVKEVSKTNILLSANIDRGIEGSTEIWTRIAGFKVRSANHYTIEPFFSLSSLLQYNFSRKEPKRMKYILNMVNMRNT